MARRSYLARLAQPLTGAGPVVRSKPRAAADESRETVAIAAPSAARAETRSPAAPTEKPVRGADADPPPRAAVGARGVAAHRNALLPTARAAPPADARRPLDSRSPPGRRHPLARPIGADVHAERAPVALGPVETDDSARPAPRAAKLEPRGERTRALATAGAAAAQPPRRAASLPVPFPIDPSPAAAAIPETASTAPNRQPAPDADVRQPRQSKPDPNPADPNPPHLHIGAIEIRVSQPAPPPPPIAIAATAPSAAAAPMPIARAYVSRFGLTQG